MKKIGIMVDSARDGVRIVNTLKRVIDLSKLMGMNALYLYVEDCIELENEPYFGYLRGRYTSKELKEIDDYAFSKGIEVIPCIQTLAHLNQIFRWDPYQLINDTDDILLVGEEKTYELIDKMFKAVSCAFRSKNVNVGMDEAYLLGRGNYYRKHGDEKSTDIFIRHVQKLSELARKYDFTLTAWSDMFVRIAGHGAEYYDKDITLDEEMLKLIPDNFSLCYWDYYHTDKKFYDKTFDLHNKFNKHISFACGSWTWTGFTPINDMALKSMKQGITSAIEHDIDELTITSWGDDGTECSIFATLPSYFYASKLFNGVTNLNEIKEEFYQTFKIKFDDFMKLDGPNMIERKNLMANPSKYLLYNDPFMGVFDESINDKYNAYYKKQASILKRVEPKLGEFGYIAKYLSSLCKVLSIKAELGIKTRKAYKSNDRESLKELIKDYKLTVKYLDRFYVDFKDYWRRENKNYGFEIHDIRIGGLKQRLLSCIESLNDYVSGKIDSIDELSQDILLLTKQQPAPYYINVYSLICSNSKL